MIIGMAFESTKEEILKNALYSELETKLLTIGGKELVYMPDRPEMLRLLIDLGQVFDASRVRMVRGKKSRCHENAEALYRKGKGKYRLAYGYGLTSDGLWRQHSWLLEQDGTIVETTVRRTVYYGLAG